MLACAALAAGAATQPEPAPPDAPAASNRGAEDHEEPEAVLLLKDGQRLTGFLVEQNDERIVLRIGAIRTPVRRSLVDRVLILPPVRERYRALRATIDDRDTAQLVRLAEWLHARGLYDEALAELDHVLRVEPDHPEAVRLRTLVSEQKRLREKAGRASPDEPPPDAPTPAPPFPLLGPDEINLIRVYEVDLSRPPRMLIDRDVITRLMTEFAGNSLVPATREGREALYRKSPAEVLELMFRLQARDLYGKVRVQEDPASMRAFRTDVHRVWLFNRCATTRCHGGTEAGRLRLYNRSPNSDATVYTNFLIVDRFRLLDGTPLINYDEPQRSPLLHYGLPRDESLYPHPPVPDAEGRGDAWRPVFRSTNDRRFREAVDWIASMYRPRPDYPIDYEPPGPPGETVPVADPAEPAPPR